MKKDIVIKYFLSELDAIKNVLCNNDLVLLLDYDGTLAPISPTPEEAVLSDDLKNVLLKLIENPRNKVAVVSGRSLIDLKGMINISGITYIGNHGFESEDVDCNVGKLLPKSYEKDISDLKQLLSQELEQYEGVWLEDKGLVLTMHYRQASEQDAVTVKNIVLRSCQSYLDEQRVKLTEGKKVLEVRPPIKWDKGEASLQLLSKWQEEGKKELSVIYIGDDVTDEDAFESLASMAFTVKVGDPENTHAKYYLKSQEEVFQTLEKISSYV